ncbi:Shedu anti-phage system protein SduA domain-containing protein [Rubinisphaera sp. JC750]|uniref:Shedu anti-phage system protein SduA domain-containing protein n=1 Tax=Rubinisphaera sp. JC750 TaxID=2898658 RepID=UPI001F37A1F9|nr:Shedu anti-phage system protein SduA domain-containing protein [Rubinisphaera sp. JC750]
MFQSNSQVTYIMDRSVPPNTTNAQYHTYVTEEWNKLLGTPGIDEKQMQEFLEKHPCLLPFGEMPLGHGNNHPLSSAVVTQPVLPGLKSKVPDFLYFTGNSGEITVVLIEIESPGKKWFTKTGQQTAELTQAANQISSWKAWFADPLNTQTFERDYMVRGYSALNNREFRQKYILVIGRRDDITDTTLNRTRHHLQPVNETWMTYDRLTCSPHWDDAVTVKLDRSGVTPQFTVIHTPPMLRLGPSHYPNYSKLEGLEAAIEANPLISRDRKNFLLKRIPYWRDWQTQTGGIATVNGGDFSGE